MFTTSTTDINVEHFANTGLTNEQFFDVCFTLADEINSYNPSTSIMSDDNKKINIDVLQKAWVCMRQIDGTPLIFRPESLSTSNIFDKFCFSNNYPSYYVRDSIDDLESIKIIKKDIFDLDHRKFITGRAIKKENGFYKIRFDFGFIWGKVWKSEETDKYYLIPKCHCQEELQELEGNKVLPVLNKAAPVEELEAPQEELQEATPVEELAEQEEDNDDYQLQMILQQLKKIKERKSDKDKKRKRVWEDLKLEMSKTEWFENGKTSANFQNVVLKKLNDKHKAFFSNGGINTIRKKIKDVDEDLVKCIAFDKYQNMMSEKILSVIEESETQSNKKKSSGYHKLLEVVDDLLKKPKRRRKR